MVTKLLYSYCGVHVVESYCKESRISDELAEMCFFIIADQNLVEFFTSSLGWLICIFQKLEYLWNKKRYLKVVNIILPVTQTASFFFFF